MSSSDRFAIDASKVVHETIDGETILIHLDSGIYYSLTGAGPDIWAMLDAGASREQVVDALARSYGADRSVVATDVDALIAHLLAADLVVPRTEPITGPPGPAVIAAVDGYRQPVLQTYTDMEYFLLLDPVHDVADAGWPHPAAGPRQPGTGSGRDQARTPYPRA